MNVLLIAFFLYLFSSIAFIVSITGKKWKSNKEGFASRLGMIGFILAVAGFICHVIFVVHRIVVGGHFPTSNMFEFMSFFGLCIVFAYLIIFWMYKLRVLGAFAMPLAVILIAYASVFPTEIQPLIPALQSHWLYIHVTTVALGQ